MTQEVLNSSENINIPHSVSFWFRKDFAGEYIELGDLLIDGVNLAPEFLDFRSYRNGLNAVRKRLLTAKNATVSMTLNEPNMLNLQRAVFGGAIAQNEEVEVFEGRHMEIVSDAGGVYIDLSDAGETDFGNIVVTGVFDKTDVLQETNLISSDISPNTDGKAILPNTEVGKENGDVVYVTYSHTLSDMFSSEIFGATKATIEGAARMQMRNPQGGVIQIWDLASVQLAPNGDLPYALDAVQTIPLLATLQERSGTFGKIYTK